MDRGKVIGKERVTIYCSETGLRLLAQASKHGGDGTFKTRPRIFEQLYIIMAWCKGVCLTAAFCLLGGKHRDTCISVYYIPNFICYMNYRKA